MNKENILEGTIVRVKSDKYGIDSITIKKDGNLYELFANHDHIDHKTRIAIIENDGTL